MEERIGVGVGVEAAALGCVTVWLLRYASRISSVLLTLADYMCDVQATLCPLKQHPNASRHNPSCASSLAYVHDWIPGETLAFEHSRGPQSAGLQ